MSNGRRLFCLLAFCGASTAFADPPLPPPPTGAPLEVPTHAVKRRSTWLENDPQVQPASAVEEVPSTRMGEPWYLDAPPAASAASACNFDVPNCADVFSPDYGNVQVLFGAYFSGKPGPSIPRFNYIPITIRQGWMLSSHDDDAMVPGNFEFLADITVAAVTSEYGTVFGGPSFLLRKNLASSNSSIVPYVQAGVGFVLNDAHQNQQQQAIGQFFEFYLHGQVGLKFFVTEHLSLDIEFGIQHISNANLASRNLGVNAFGGQVGFSYYFPWQTQ